MTSQSELEINGNFHTHPFAELLAEIAQSRLDGSLRVSVEDKKCVVYFKDGRVVFAVSNARASRLFDILLRQGRLSKEDLAKFPNFANDLEFSESLLEKQVVTKEERDQLFTAQIEEMLIDILSWPTGVWTFSSLARIRSGLEFQVGTARLLLDYGRCLTGDMLLVRFRGLGERFARSERNENLLLTEGETFVLSRAVNAALTPSDLIKFATMPQETALRSIYALWLCGLLVRNDWQAAFSAAAISAIKDAKLEIKKHAQLPKVSIPAGETREPGARPQEPEIAITLDEYLERVENAKTHYEILGINQKADFAEMKRAYFALAKMFHPDRYHSEGGETRRRIQSAFTELAQAHETLKNDDSREAYDYKMRGELGDSDNAGDAVSTQFEQAAEQFKNGYSLLLDEETEAALPFLARAVHFDPKNARYHAYYGKALATDAKKRHKAESEMQAALKIEPNNATFRILLAEFYIKFNLPKRAEGELTRLLAIAPNNREAQNMLESLKR